MNVSKTIFLADDDQDDRFFLREAIVSIDNTISIVEATDGIELLAIIENDTPSGLTLIVLDMNMPRLNGLETILKIRSIPSFSTIPAIMISTSSDPWLSEKAQKAGINQFLTKPSNLQGFFDLATALCNAFNLNADL